jgi:hypothetical protein
MEGKDKQLAADSVIVIADAIVANLPPLNIAWNLSKAFFGASLKFRQNRALEWVEMIRDKPEIFSYEILNNEEFQDGFVFLFEKYLTERRHKRREYLRNIFLCFAVAENKAEFELERFADCLSRLNETDMEVLGYVDTKTVSHYQITDNDHLAPNVYNLINAGILRPATTWDDNATPYVYTTPFGRDFIKYLKAN